MRTKQDLLNQMAKLNACIDATEWVRKQKLETAQAIWDACESPSWMLWYAARCGVAHKTLVRLAAAFARSVLFLVPKGEERPRICIKTVEAWCAGRATVDEVKAAWRNASAAAAAAAAYAADAAYDAAYAAVDAANAAAYAAAYAAYAQHAKARKQVQIAQCELIRKAIPVCPFKGSV
jgi:hypothetical protein